MPNGQHLCHPDDRPGPKPIFTERLVLNIRPDQRQALNRISQSLDRNVSEIVRWILDNGIDAIEQSWKETAGG